MKFAHQTMLSLESILGYLDWSDFVCQCLKEKALPI